MILLCFYFYTFWHGTLVEIIVAGALPPECTLIPDFMHL